MSAEEARISSARTYRHAYLSAAFRAEADVGCPGLAPVNPGVYVTAFKMNAQPAASAGRAGLTISGVPVQLLIGGVGHQPEPSAAVAQGLKQWA